MILESLGKKDAQPKEGNITHRISDFPAQVAQHTFFPMSNVALVRLDNGSVYLSSDAGFTWKRLELSSPSETTYLQIYIHPFSSNRAYLITTSHTIWFTGNHGQTWTTIIAPSDLSIFGIQALEFHPLESDWLIWSGTTGECLSGRESKKCAASAFYSTDNGHSWHLLEEYVKTCQWARETELRDDARLVMCESYRDKNGDQRFFNMGGFGKAVNPVRLIEGSSFLQTKRVMFENVIGFTKYADYLLVAEYIDQRNALELQVSPDGRKFSSGRFPPSLGPDSHAYTILESSTSSVFLHLTTSDTVDAEYGHILKSNSNGTHYTISIFNVTRDKLGFADFEKMIGLEGIALVNVVTNPEEAVKTRRKELQTRITHNDGGTWESLKPPVKDSRGQAYKCNEMQQCALHIHNFAGRYDTKATLSSPAIPGVIISAGNVGGSLAPYSKSDMFLSRDGGITWQEIHKGPHIWRFGDSGSILVLADSQHPTDGVLFSIDEGETWRYYNFGRTLRVKSLSTPSESSRKFVLYGHSSETEHGGWTAVHLDFTALTNIRCVFNPENPNIDDFELWSPTDGKIERCLFGRVTTFLRRKRDRNCYIGDLNLKQTNIVRNCECTDADFECNFNHIRNQDGICVLAQRVSPDGPDEQCKNGASEWFEQIAYRKISWSSCEGGMMLDPAVSHPCPKVSGNEVWVPFWIFMALIVAVVAAIVMLLSIWCRRYFARGFIHLPDVED